MIDPDQFLAIELASGKAEAVMDEDLTSLSWLHTKNVLKGTATACGKGKVRCVRRGACGITTMNGKPRETLIFRDNF